LTAEEAWVAANERSGLNDGRSQTRTTFYSGDDAVNPDGPPSSNGDGTGTSWETLAKVNDGMWASDRSTQNFNADIQRWIQTFCGHLGLGRQSYYQGRTEYIVESIDLGSFSSIPAEHVILSAISLGVDADIDAESVDIESWDLSDWIIYRDDFQGLMDDLEMTMDDLWTARKIIIDQVDDL